MIILCNSSLILLFQLSTLFSLLYILYSNIAVLIPVKNLLKVNTNEETLSTTANYSILRHCALSELFKYEPNNRTIPNYAHKNFHTHFTYCCNVVDKKSSKICFTVQTITNSHELTLALEESASTYLLDDNDDIILHIHCKFINQFHYLHKEQVEKLRKEATVAADNAFQTFKEWVKKASHFVKSQVSMIGSSNSSEDYVLITSSGTSNNNGKKFCEDEKEDVHHDPMEWTTRFVQALLAPNVSVNLSSQTKERCDEKTEKESQLLWYYTETQLEQYEDSLDALADSLIKGIDAVSRFVVRAIEKHHENKIIVKRDNDDDELSLSPEDHPSLAASVSLSSISSKSSISSNGSIIIGEDNVVVEEGVEVIVDDSSSNEEWKIFFGEQDLNCNSGSSSSSGTHSYEEEVVIINTPCDEDVVSLDSCVFEENEDKVDNVENNENDAGDDASWAVLSDEE